jgi:stage III sporulation protein AB
MLTVIGIILVLFASAAFAIKRLLLKTNRIEKTRQIKRALSVLAERMEFTNRPLGELFEQLAIEEESKDFFAALLSGLQDGENRPLSEIWSEALGVYAAKESLSPKTVSVLSDVGSNLGKMSQKGEIEFLHIADKELEKEISKLEEDFEKNSGALKSSGILVGILIVILFL